MDTRERKGNAAARRKLLSKIPKTPMSPDNSKQEEMRKDREFINEYITRMAAILRPAVHLIDFAENRFPQKTSDQTKDDILRMAVVFLHATLEDFLRYIGSRYIVGADLDKRTFGNTDRISELLKSAGIPPNEFKKFYPSLSELMVRRHQIVHKGDLKATINQEGERVPKPIDASKVKEWSKTVPDFVNAVAAYKLEAGV